MHGLKKWLDRSVPAQALLIFLLLAGATELIRPGLPVAQWLVQSVLWTAFCVLLVVVRRRQDRKERRAREHGGAGVPRAAGDRTPAGVARH
ncbi:hypothetical protein [Streptomyces sp. NPDC051569]|uniref:hypothetical protein n=1 Tax=Streptomyces sp. NPDC051569 TaxID=3365661 RepID=UPI0037B26328